MIWARNLKLFTKLGAATLALGALATGGNAQDSFHGKFTLPFETRWGSATLPPGDYTFTLPSNSAPYRFYIQGQGASAIIQATTAEEKVVSERSQLSLVDIAAVHTVQTFEAPELGVTKEKSHASHCKRQVHKDSGWIPGKAHGREAA